MTGPDIRWSFIGRAVGDFRVPPAESVDGDLRAYGMRLSSVADGRPVTWMRQVHGSDVVTVTGPGEHVGASADAAVTERSDVALAVLTADCAPVLLHASAGDRSAIAVAHAGWRGLLDGVLLSAATALTNLPGLRDGPGPVTVRAVLGPCIGPECYEFGGHDLATIADRFGPTVFGRTSTGAPALDLGAGVTAALAEVGVPVDRSAAACTACDGEHWYSHRARRDVGRQVLVAWLAATGASDAKM